jgi:hypothetical protein
LSQWRPGVRSLWRNRRFQRAFLAFMDAYCYHSGCSSECFVCIYGCILVAFMGEYLYHLWNLTCLTKSSASCIGLLPSSPPINCKVAITGPADRRVTATRLTGTDRAVATADRISPLYLVDPFSVSIFWHLRCQDLSYSRYECVSINVTWGLPVECTIGRDTAVILVDCKGAGHVVRRRPQARSSCTVAVGQGRRWCRHVVVVAAQNWLPPNVTLHGAAQGVEWRSNRKVSHHMGEDNLVLQCKLVKGGSTCPCSSLLCAPKRNGRFSLYNLIGGSREGRLETCGGSGS